MIPSSFKFKGATPKTETERLRRQAQNLNLTRSAKHRLEWMIHANEGKNVRATCRHYDLKPKVYYFWRHRFETEGCSGLEERSRKPKTMRKTKRTLEEEMRMVALRKKHLRSSAKKLSVRYANEHLLKYDDGFPRRLSFPEKPNAVFAP